MNWPARLADLCRELGGETAAGPLAGQEAASWGDPASEYRALTAGCGLVARPERGVLDLTGEDRQRFVHGLVTCDVKGVGPGDGRYGFFTDIHGKILADAVILAAGERLRLELPAPRRQTIEDHLSKYRIVDRVELERPDATAVLLLAGPAAPAAARQLTGAEPPSEAWSHRAFDTPAGPAWIYADGLWGGDTFGVVAPPTAAAGWLRQAAAEGLGPARPVGWRAFESFRIERGLPLYGLEYDGDAFPQETGIDTAVSYEKGCYLGQEVVARIHYRGKVNRVLRGLRLAAGPPPAPGSEVVYEGRAAGLLGGVAESPRAGGLVALTLLHRRAAEPGTRVHLAGGKTAEVVELPFG